MTKQRVTLFLAPGLIKKAKAQALNEGISLSDFTQKAWGKVLPRIVKVTIKKGK